MGSEKNKIALLCLMVILIKQYDDNCFSQDCVNLTVGDPLCRWASGKRWFMGRQRTSWSWQNRPVSTWTLTRRLALPQGPLCFKAVPPLLRRQHYDVHPTTKTSTESRKRQSSEDKWVLFLITMQKCTAKDVHQKARLLVLFFDTFLGDCPSTFLLFIGSSCASFLNTHRLATGAVLYRYEKG